MNFVCQVTLTVSHQVLPEADLGDPINFVKILEVWCFGAEAGACAAKIFPRIGARTGEQGLSR